LEYLNYDETQELRTPVRAISIVLAASLITLTLGFLLKARCMGAIEGLEGYRDLCVNDPQELFGARSGAGFPWEGLEDPVRTGAFMWLTALVADTPDSFLVATALGLAPFALIAAYLLAKESGTRALMFAASPALVMYAFHSWDLLLVLAVVAGLVLAKDRPEWAALMFVIGAAVKFTPIIFIAPLLLIHRDRMKQILLVTVGSLAVLNLPWALLDFDGWRYSFTMHSERPANPDSLWHFLWSGSVEGLNLLTLVLFILGAGVVLWVGRDKPFVQMAAALLCVFLLVNKVHSPQYTLWLLPFLVLVRVHWLWWFAYSVADFLVFVGIYRWFYAGTEVESLMWTTGVWARAGLLVGLIVAFLRSTSPSLLADPALSDPRSHSGGGPNPMDPIGTQ
jgi:hypothetical protein